MHLQFRNVNDAFAGLVEGIQRNLIPTVATSSRVGNVYQVTEPITVTYTHPTERVLLNTARDANPFFHLFESLWMLAGREDVKPLLWYNSKIGEVASDDGEVFNGAYGYRWRHSWGISDQGELIEQDQFHIIINQLKRKPDSRRVVLSMWNIGDDLLKIDTTKDVCCNTHAYFLINRGRLDMTVCNRSNDMIWGMLGANVVHFSFLQEYIAQAVGVPVGCYNQFTNNLHVYESNWKPIEWLSKPVDFYPNETHMALVKDIKVFDQECAAFVEDIDTAVTEPFLRHVAAPMCLAFRHHKEKDYVRAFEALRLVAMNDWQHAAYDWLAKREKAYRIKFGEPSNDNPYLFREFKRQTSGHGQA